MVELFETLRIVEDVDDLLEDDYLEVLPIEDALDPINDAIETVDDTIEGGQDVFDIDDNRDAIDEIDTAIGRETVDVRDGYD